MKKITRAVASFLTVVSLSAIMAGGQANTDDSSGKKIEITAKRYDFSPEEITLVKGQPVTIVLTTSDVSHGLRIKDLNFNLETKPGHPGSATLTPDKTGTFNASCSRFCGLGHGSMRMKITVVESAADATQK